MSMYIPFDPSDEREMLRGSFVKRIRRFHSLTQEQFAAVMPVKLSMLIHWENDRKIIPLEELRRLYQICSWDRREKLHADKIEFCKDLLRELIYDMNYRFDDGGNINAIVQAIGQLRKEL